MKGLPPVLITSIVLVPGFAACAVQFPNFASIRVVGNLLTDALQQLLARRPVARRAGAAS